MTALFKKILNIFVLLIMSMTCYSQVGIYNENPDPSAVLDITSTDKGFLMPSLTTSQKLAISSPAQSLLVYDSDLNCISQNIGTEAKSVMDVFDRFWELLLLYAIYKYPYNNSRCYCQS